MEYQSNLTYFLEDGVLIRLNSKLKLSAVGLDETRLYKPISDKEDRYFYKNDWTSFAFRCMLTLRGKFNPEVDSFLSIGTGSGLETLCAVEVFDPQNVTITDLDLSTVKHAEWNINFNLRNPNHINIETKESTYFDKLDPGDGMFDLIYENLPNIPFKYESAHQFKNVEQPLHASFAVPDNFKVPVEVRKNLLFSHYIFLMKAKPFLKPNGGVLCLIGARVSINIILEMFANCGYTAAVLVYDFKMQNEPYSNIPSYEEAEKDEAIDFTFYDFENVLPLFESQDGYDPVSGIPFPCTELHKELEKRKLTAKEATRRLNEDKIEIGHEVVGIYARLNSYEK